MADIDTLSLALIGVLFTLYAVIGLISHWESNGGGEDK